MLQAYSVWFEYFEEQIIKIMRVIVSLPINSVSVVGLEDAKRPYFPFESKEFVAIKKSQKTCSFTIIKANSSGVITIAVQTFAFAIIAVVIAFAAEAGKIVTVIVTIVVIILIAISSAKVTAYLQQRHSIA